MQQLGQYIYVYMYIIIHCYI